MVAKAKLALDIKKNVKNIASNSMHRSVMHQLCADTFQVQKGHRNDKFQIHFKYQEKKPTHDFFSSCGMWFFSVNPFIIFS